MFYECDEEHKKIIDIVLQTLSVADDVIKSTFVAIIQNDGTCAMSWEDLSIDDMIQVKGHIELAITKKYMEMNWPSIINDETRTFEGMDD